MTALRFRVHIDGQVASMEEFSELLPTFDFT